MVSRTAFRDRRQRVTCDALLGARQATLLRDAGISAEARASRISEPNLVLSGEVSPRRVGADPRAGSLFVAWFSPLNLPLMSTIRLLRTIQKCYIV
jgi:hypothetical protein